MKIEKEESKRRIEQNDLLPLKNIRIHQNGKKTKKRDIMTMINLEIGLYLPPDRYVNSFFIKEILNGKKKSLKRNKVLFVKRCINFKEV